MSYIPLPPSIANTEAVINVKNSDQQCFAYAIMSKELHERGIRDPQRVSRYTDEIWSHYNFDGVRFPTPFRDIPTFERNNNASVNLYGLEKGTRGFLYVYPIRVSDNVRETNHFDLLYLQEEDENGGESEGHYCDITDLARLVRAQITTNHNMVICRRCLRYFGRQELLDTHKRLCELQDPVRCRMPRADR